MGDARIRTSPALRLRVDFRRLYTAVMSSAAVQAEALTTWFEGHRRVLPWRVEPRDPYRVLVSEVMLQQTQVDRVAPRFEAFVIRFPTIAALAAASDDEVTAAWSGLGYYRRARALAALAREVVRNHGGMLPRTSAELRGLPGIGPYTAAAVASLAHGEAVPVIDGNVLRVGARVLAVADDLGRRAGRQPVEAWAGGLVAAAPPALVNEGLMELGALVCTPTSPDCAHCPLARWCHASAQGLVERIPAPRRTPRRQSLRWVFACAEDGAGRWLLRQVRHGPILRGLWLPPYTEVVEEDPAEDVARALLPFTPDAPGVRGAPVQHSITFRDITATVVAFAVGDTNAAPSGWRWHHPDEGGLATSSLLAKLRRSLAGTGPR